MDSHEVPDTPEPMRRCIRDVVWNQVTTFSHKTLNNGTTRERENGTTGEQENGRAGQRHSERTG